MASAPKPNSRKRFDEADRAAVAETLKQDELWPYMPNSDGKNYWHDFRGKLEAYYSHKSKIAAKAIPASSGTAAIHVALGGLQIPAGSEVIVPPITDIGTIMPVIFQNCVPVFADVDRNSGLLTSETINNVMSDRTRCVIVVHLSGSPADMDPIMDLCRSHDVKVIEDTAQALGASYKGRPAGTFGDAGAFSLNSWKHITAGEGGFVLVDASKSEDTFLRCLNFSDKHRNRTGDTTPEHSIYAGSGLNYRMSDLELSLASSQFDKLIPVTSKFNQLGSRLDERIDALPNVQPQRHHDSAHPTYFFSFFRLSKGDRPLRDSILERLEPIAKSLGMGLAPSYGNKPLYAYDVFQRKNFFDTVDQFKNGTSIWPAELVCRSVFPNVPDAVFDFKNLDSRCPNTKLWIDLGFGLYFNESHELEHIDYFADQLGAALADSL